VMATQYGAFLEFKASKISRCSKGAQLINNEIK